jgi:ketopantoate reductase
MDLEAGHLLELEWMTGATARLGDELAVPTPTHHFIRTALKLYANGGPKIGSFVPAQTA